MNYTPSQPPADLDRPTSAVGNGLVHVPHETTPDPYPDELAPYPGVCQRTELTPLPDWEATSDVGLSGPLPVTASLPPATAGPDSRRLPWEATGLYGLGQVVLAAVIGVDRINPLVGVTVSLLWLICGLALIAAQVVSERQRP